MMADSKQPAELTACPICGFPFESPIDEATLSSSYDICGCCGCEYGYDDHIEFRKQWIADGANWFHPERKPAQWSLEEQLKSAINDWLNFNYRKSSDS